MELSNPIAKHLIIALKIRLDIHLISKQKKGKKISHKLTAKTLKMFPMFNEQDVKKSWRSCLVREKRYDVKTIQHDDGNRYSPEDMKEADNFLELAYEKISAIKKQCKNISVTLEKLAKESPNGMDEPIPVEVGTALHWKFLNPNKNISNYEEVIVLLRKIPSTTGDSTSSDSSSDEEPEPKVIAKTKGKPVKKKTKKPEPKRGKMSLAKGKRVKKRKKKKPVSDGGVGEEGSEADEASSGEEEESYLRNDKVFHFDRFIMYSILPVMRLLTTGRGGYERIRQWLDRLPIDKKTPSLPSSSEEYNQLNARIHKVHITQKMFRTNIVPSKTLDDMLATNRSSGRTKDHDVVLALRIDGTPLNRITIPAVSKPLANSDKSAIDKFSSDLNKIINITKVLKRNKRPASETKKINDKVRHALIGVLTRFVRDVRGIDDGNAEIVSSVLIQMLNLEQWERINVESIEEVMITNPDRVHLLLGAFTDTDINADSSGILRMLYEKYSGKRKKVRNIIIYNDNKVTESSSGNVIARISEESL